MENKENLQAEELDQVAGGLPSGGYAFDRKLCFNCNEWFWPSEKDGTYLSIKHSCFSYENYYVCPYCGTKRKVT